MSSSCCIHIFDAHGSFRPTDHALQSLYRVRGSSNGELTSLNLHEFDPIASLQPEGCPYLCRDSDLAFRGHGGSHLNTFGNDHLDD
ncbi:hypothetical protein PS639_04322 [Pseudomonas fluorescens]|nr:hypothetical protein PS639_04322 [Pseudomonas fluorescens]